jgi:dienelactone hydrolase
MFRWISRRWFVRGMGIATLGVAFAAVLLVPLVGWAQATSAPQPLPETSPWPLERLMTAPKMEWVDQTMPVHSLFYEGEPYEGKATRVFAYYASPLTLEKPDAAEAVYPAVILVHGGGGTAFREWALLWAERGYVALAMDLAGQRPIEGKNAHQRENRQRLTDGGPDQGDAEKFGRIDLAPGEQWSYHAIANVILGHSLLRSFREVDATRTAITGISWGGYLTCIAAGVDSRFRAAVPVYGCGFLHENSAWLDRLKNMTPAQRERWITLWDPSRYLPSVAMPILFVNGTNDFAYPLDSYMKSFDAVRGEKQLRVTVNLPHSHPAGWAPNEIARFIDQHLRGGEPLPTLSEPREDGGSYIFSCSSKPGLARADLHWTRENSPINKRIWQSQSLVIDRDSIRVTAPEPGTTAWFITVTDAAGGTISSRTFFP